MLFAAATLLILVFNGICSASQPSPQSAEGPIESYVDPGLSKEAENRGTEEMLAGQMDRALPYLSYAQRAFPDETSLVLKLNYTLGTLAGQEYSGKVLSFHLDGIEFSPDSKRILCWSGMDRPAIIFNRQRDTPSYALTRPGMPRLLEIPGDDAHCTVAGAQFFGADSVFLVRSTLDKIDTEFGMQVGSLDLGRTIKCIASLPNSDLLVCATKDGHLLTVQATTGDLLQDLAPPADLGDVDVTEMKRGSDGRFVVVIGRKGRVLYDLKKAVCVRSGEFESVKAGSAFFPDGRHLLYVNQNKAIGLLDAESGQISNLDLSELLKSHNALVSCDVGADGKTLALGTTNGGTFLYLFAAKSMLWLPSQMGVVSKVAFSPNGKFLASAQSAVYLWDASTGRLLAHWLPQVTLVHDLKFSPDSACLAAAYDDGRLMVLDTKSGSQKETIEGSRDKSILFATLESVSPDCTKVLTVSGNHVLSLDRKDQDALNLSNPRNENIESASYSADSQFLAIGFADGAVGVWSTLSGAALFTTPKAFLKPKYSADHIALADNSLITVGQRGTMMAWDFVEQKELWETDVAKPVGYHESLQMAGNNVLYFDGQKALQVRDAHSGSLIYQFEMADGIITIARLSKDGKRLAFGNDQGAVQLKAIDDDSNIEQVAVHSSPICLLEWSPSGDLLLSAGAGRKIVLTDLTTRKDLMNVDLVSNFVDSPFLSACFSHGQDFVCVGGMGRVLVLDARNGQFLAGWTVPASVVRVFAAPHGLDFMASDQTNRVHRWSIPESVDRQAVERALANDPWILDGLELKGRRER